MSDKDSFKTGQPHDIQQARFERATEAVVYALADYFSLEVTDAQARSIAREVLTAIDNTQQSEYPDALTVGDHVRKIKGYAFPGVVVSTFNTLAGKGRYVVECTSPDVEGCLHIYNADQLKKVDQPQSEDTEQPMTPKRAYTMGVRLRHAGRGTIREDPDLE